MSTGTPESTPETATRDTLMSCYRAGVETVAGDRVVAAVLEQRSDFATWHIAAIGKAAISMAAGANRILGNRIRQMIIVTDQPDAAASTPELSGACVFSGEHPVPGSGSLAAGQALIDFVSEVPRSDGLLFLISGGASSLAEVPVTDVGPDQLRKVNQWLLGSGLGIEDMNAVRRGLSQIKGGGLGRLVRAGRCLALYISDVPGDDPAVIGSGLLAQSTHPVPGSLPGWLQVLLREPGDCRRGSPPDHIEHEVIANIETAMAGAAETAMARGIKVRFARDHLSGDAAAAGRKLSEELLASAAGLLIAGGETTVQLPESAGAGGRCQHLALRAAISIARRPGTALLAAGTDGRDGPGCQAGAIVDGSTLERGRQAGLDAGECLERADSGRFLAAAGALIPAVATGTNVADLVLGLKWPAN